MGKGKPYTKNRDEIEEIVKDIWYSICILKRDYGIGWEEYMVSNMTSEELFQSLSECSSGMLAIQLENKQKARKRERGE